MSDRQLLPSARAPISFTIIWVCLSGCKADDLFDFVFDNIHDVEHDHDEMSAEERLRCDLDREMQSRARELQERDQQKAMMEQFPKNF
jgi:hypothetical protein